MFLKGSQFLTELVVSLVLIGVLLLYLHPSNFLMPMTLEATLVLMLVTAFLAFLGLVWKETANDEREELHRLHAGRYSFLAGATVLVAGILTQNLTHQVDPWLVATLVIMILIKVFVRVYTQLRK